jgi:hypothetical protein
MVLKIGIYSGAAEHLMGINKGKVNFPVNSQGNAAAEHPLKG